MAIMDRESKIIYTGGNITWLPYVIQNGDKFYFRYKKGKIVPLDTLEKYKEEASLIGYKVIELEEIYKEFGIEIIEIGKSAILIDGVIVDGTTDSNNITLSFVKIACKLGFCNNKSNFASRKLKLRKIKRNIIDLEVFLDIRKNKVTTRRNKVTKKYNARTNNKEKIAELQKMLKQNGLKYSTYNGRVKRGWDRYKAMTTPPMPAHKSTLKESVDHEGRKFESVEKMVHFHGISKHTFYKRKKKGLSLEECLAPADQKFNTSSKIAKDERSNKNRR